MTFNTFKSILQAHSDKDPKIATQEITSDVYEVYRMHVELLLCVNILIPVNQLLQ